MAKMANVAIEKCLLCTGTVFVVRRVLSYVVGTVWFVTQKAKEGFAAKQQPT